MTLVTAKKCINKLLNKKFNNFVIFFGGEPFLNFSLMKKIEKYGRKAGLEIKYIAETNGTIMNDAIEEFIAEKFSSIGISLDGPKEINDRQRYGNVSSVHDLAIMAIKRLKSKKISISVKCTATVSTPG